MNKINKRLFISAGISLVLGLMLFVPSLLTAIPYLQNVIAKAETNTKQEVVEIITEPIERIVIEAGNIALRIEESKSDEIQVSVENSQLQTLEVTTAVQEQQLTVVASQKNFFALPQISLDANRFVEDVVKSFVNEQVATIVVQVPKQQQIEFEVVGAGNIVIANSDLLGAETQVTHAGMFTITETTAPTAGKKLVYRNTDYYNTVLDYRVLNAFSDVSVQADYIAISNDTYTETLTTENLTIEANSIAYQYLPFTGTVTLRDAYGLNLNFATIPNIDWQIKTNSFEIISYDGETIVHGSPWQFTGYFWPEQTKATGKLIVESTYIGITTQQTSEVIADFAQNQLGLEVKVETYGN